MVDRFIAGEAQQEIQQDDEEEARERKLICKRSEANQKDTPEDICIYTCKCIYTALFNYVRIARN